MKSILVFDEYVDLEQNPSFPNGSVDLFPLTGDFSVIGRVKEAIEAGGGGPVRLLDSARLVDEEVSLLRTRVCGWSAEIGETKVFARTIKEWFLVPQSRVSTWWFSLLSEKNTFKTNAFFNLARVNALKKVVASNGYQQLFLSVLDTNFEKALRRVASTGGVQEKAVPGRLPTGRKELIKYVLERIGLLGELFFGLFIFIRFFVQRFQATRRLEPLAKRMPDSNSCLFVSYFPSADPKASDKGEFKSKYYAPIQEKLVGWNRNPAWLLMHVSMSGKSFRHSLGLAQAFIRNGERMYFLPEFLTIRDFLFCLIFWMRQVVLCSFLYFFSKRSLFRDPMSDESAPILRSLWFKSFCGTPGAEGILYYNAFRGVFATLLNITDVVYFMEMHAWEKALNAAARIENTEARTIGFQHTAMSSNYFHFFYDPAETGRPGKDTDLPLPDVMAITGEHTKSLLAGCGYPNIAMVESVRHLYVNKLVSGKLGPKPVKPVLLVAGSISEIENRSLAAFIYQAFPGPEAFEIWFKAHPMAPFESAFKALGIDTSETGYVIRGGSIADALAVSSAVFVPTSTVSIEALAFECEVIIPVLPDSMLMNPLSDYEDFYHKITKPCDLKKTVEAILFESNTKNVSSYKSFVEEFWFTDPNLPKWGALLSNSHASSVSART